jgi:hypothetical protein
MAAITDRRGRWQVRRACGGLAGASMYMEKSYALLCWQCREEFS